MPRKNIAPVAGKPLIAWTLEAARASRHVTRLIVSTDDEEIGAVARAHGAELPFVRPAELARDDTPSMAVIEHAIRRMDEDEGFRPDYVLLLQPTSPLRTTADIDGAVALAAERRAESVVSVAPAADHPYWTKRITTEGVLEDYFPQSEGITRRQDLPPAFSLNGAIYLTRRDLLVERGSFYSKGTYAYVMPPERSLDIDTPWDLRIAELMLAERANGRGA